VGLKFEPGENPTDNGLRNLSYAELTGIDPWVEMPKQRERLDRWHGLTGFQRDPENFPTTS
jgi:hypothetical protein